MTDESSTRLNKLLALRLGTSRRESDEMIEAGRVLVNGTTARLGERADETSTITVDGKPLVPHVDHSYVLFNKPAGYVCSRKAQGETPTIYEILPDEYATLKPVGRLDKDSSGVLLLTNDGDFAHSMTHPSFHKIKTYQVVLDSPLAPLHQQMISDYGIDIGDGVSKLALERVNDDRTEWIITMHEGRNRQIRRTFASLGYSIVSLRRNSFGPYNDADLEIGKFRTFIP